MGEVLVFPAGRHDDQVDALSQFLAWASTSRSHTVSIFGPRWFDGVEWKGCDWKFDEPD
jgi:hypothetical protein